MSLLFLDLGTGEVLLIVLAIFLVFGPGKIPELARGLGKFVSEIKKASEDVKNEINREADRIERETKLKEYQKKLDLDGNTEDEANGEESQPAQKKKTPKARSSAKKTTPANADIVSEEQDVRPVAKKATPKRKPAASAKSKTTTGKETKATARKTGTTAKKKPASAKEAKSGEKEVKKTPARKPAAKKAKSTAKEKTPETVVKKEVNSTKPVAEIAKNQS